jgi:acyl-CoA dehydrogenase
MDFALDEQQRLLVETVRAFIKAELAPLEDEVENTGVLRPELARSIHAKAKALGLYAMNIPEQFGGGGFRRSIKCWSRNSSAIPPTS